MIVKPPSFENHVLDRSNGSIVIGKGFSGNIKAEHTGVPKSYISPSSKISEAKTTKKLMRTGVSRHSR